MKKADRFELDMRLSDVVRIILVLILVIFLCWLTYLSIRQLFQEETTVSQHFEEDGADFPSITICLKWLGSSNGHLSLPESKDWTFKDYMDKVPNIRSIITFGNFRDQPSDKFM